jgi:antitoxin component YwqK of YwqJK toxin-antitoxin module
MNELRMTFSVQMTILGLAMVLGFAPLTGAAQPGASSGVAVDKSKWPQGEPGIDYNIKDERGRRQGEWIRVWPDGKLYYKGSFKDDLPVGTFNFYHESGELMSVLQHTSGGERVFAEHYRPDGSKNAEGLYLRSRTLDENGEPLRLKQGPWKYYDGAGNLRLLETYANGELNGAYASYSDEGQILEEGSFVAGERDGAWKTYNEMGIELSEINYKSGLFDGATRVYYDSGRPLMMGLYRDGNEAGVWITFHPDGSIEQRRHFTDGVLTKEEFVNGTFETTFSDGRPKTEYTFKDGVRHGMFREWHDAGGPVIKERLDELSGETYYEEVMEGLMLKKEGEYVEGKLDGTLYYYDLNGRIVKQEEYEQGTKLP